MYPARSTGASSSCGRKRTGDPLADRLAALIGVVNARDVGAVKHGPGPAVNGPVSTYLSRAGGIVTGNAAHRRATCLCRNGPGRLPGLRAPRGPRARGPGRPGYQADATGP